MDIRTSYWKLRSQHVKKEVSILNVFSTITYVLGFLSPIIWCGLILEKRKIDKFPSHIAEIYLTLILTIQLVFLFTYKEGMYSFVIYAFAIYCLLDTWIATFRDFLLSPNIHSGKIQIYNHQRWLLLTLINAAEVILSFAIIMLKYGNHFKIGNSKEALKDPIAAIYYSTVTFSSVGFGDTIPTDNVGRSIIMAELAFFFLFLVLKFPIAVGMFKTDNLNHR